MIAIANAMTLGNYGAQLNSDTDSLQRSMAYATRMNKLFEQHRKMLLDVPETGKRIQELDKQIESMYGTPSINKEDGDTPRWPERYR